MTASQVTVTVRPLASVEEYRACQEVQRRAWGIAEEGYLIPVATMISVQHAGGLVLGAFIDQRLVGFSFAYLGRVEGQWALYSQLTGVDPSAQDHGIGGRLKAAQREWTREQGLALVVWSFDPLQAGNANFNLHRLGAICRTYYPNYFGERSDALNAGLETDRLLALWDTADQRHRWQGDGQTLVTLLGSDVRRDELLTPSGSKSAEAIAAGPEPTWLQIQIPPDFAALKARDARLARAWQEAVRLAFRQAFAAGYAAMDFHREGAGDEARCWYELRRPVEGSEQ
ncbi:MAG: hypothetical protein ACRDJE_16220 [Dehalococcoidia bacterium]